MSSARDDLEFAYKLIKRDKTQDALDLLRPIVAMEPENVHAWWLLAYAASEPREAREALIQVLRLDPTYVNAPKAREMLGQLNQQYPPEFDEIQRFPELQNEYSVVQPSSMPDPFTTGPADESDEEMPAFLAASPSDLDSGTEEPPDDLFDSVLFADNTDELFPEEDPFAGLEQDLMAVEATDAADAALASLTFDDDIFQGFEDTNPPEPDFPGDLFGEESQPAHQRQAKRGRGVTMLLMALVVVVIALVGVLAVYFLMGSDDDQGTPDPGALQVLTLDNPQIASAQSAVEAQLPNVAPGGEGRAVVAPSSLGNTFYLELCAAPSPALPQIVTAGMGLAAGQAPTLQEQVSAVGITVDACDAAGHDKLYRAVAPIDQALQYANGEITWDQFRAAWILA
ncbi:MAG TPA: hypothetical protein PKD09_00780 [Aggregatilinea sp.]|uniref:tetratricopeptide repeat protein n=1 Tax=Aggregatilinea sp. TaxID=2806333 RepID=UPI002C68D54A|nr:hypothetical protein [Aggregatilinea sp.]HML20149.1 hypothetical protein [Aggregatilinea sp.]